MKPLQKNAPVSSRRNLDSRRVDPEKSSQVRRCVRSIREHFGQSLPTIALVLGSGFQELLSVVSVCAEVPYGQLPGFPVPAVKGHPGRLALGKLGEMNLLVCCGRAHFYEGHSMEAVMFPIDVLAECGVTELILTNAAGCINRNYRPGEFMIFSDHINMVGVNPLRGLPVYDGQCFVDLTDAYCPALRRELKVAARREGIRLREGIYLGVSGPSYETPAEIRAFRMLGADAVGMSTIPEVLMARYHGIRVAAISCLTNYAAGVGRGKLSHLDVLQTGRENAAAAGRLLRSFAQGRSRKKNLRKSNQPLGCSA